MRVTAARDILLHVMKKRAKSTEVFAPNAVTRAALKAEIAGVYEPTGPNKWDDFELTPDDGEPFEVDAETRIQVEPIGAEATVRFRVRRGRTVLICRWVPTEHDEAEIASGKWGVQEAEQASRLERILGLAPKNDPRDDMHEYFLDVLAEPIH